MNEPNDRPHRSSTALRALAAIAFALIGATVNRVHAEDELEGYRAFSGPRHRSAGTAASPVRAHRAAQGSTALRDPKNAAEVQARVNDSLERLKLELQATEDEPPARGMLSPGPEQPVPAKHAPPRSALDRPHAGTRAGQPALARTPLASRPGGRELDKVPSSPEFQRYREMLREQVAIRLIVNASDEDHLSSVLGALDRVRQRANVVLDELLFVGPPHLVQRNLRAVLGSPEASAPAAPVSELRVHETSYDGYADPSSLISRFRLTRSPVWIIRYRGKDWVFEGVLDPRSFL